MSWPATPLPTARRRETRARARASGCSRRGRGDDCGSRRRGWRAARGREGNRGARSPRRSSRTCPRVPGRPEPPSPGPGPSRASGSSAGCTPSGARASSPSPSARSRWWRYRAGACWSGARWVSRGPSGSPPGWRRRRRLTRGRSFSPRPSTAAASGASKHPRRKPRWWRASRTSRRWRWRWRGRGTAPGGTRGRRRRFTRLPSRRNYGCRRPGCSRTPGRWCGTSRRGGRWATVGRCWTMGMMISWTSTRSSRPPSRLTSASTRRRWATPRPRRRGRASTNERPYRHRPGPRRR